LLKKTIPSIEITSKLFYVKQVIEILGIFGDDIMCKFISLIIYESIDLIELPKMKCHNSHLAKHETCFKIVLDVN
jgi:hypothetical protein